jgi:uncharacterized protein (DUF1499 family)
MNNHARDVSHHIASLAYPGDASTAMTRLAQIAARQQCATLAGQNRDYTCAALQTPVMGFAENVPFLANPAPHVIDVRSASRSGHSDPRVNRKRVEAVRATIAAETR